MDEILTVDNLKTSFMTSNGEVQAVRGVSFSVKKGEILGIVGESGSGKSVTSMSILRLLADTARIKEGKIVFDGTDLLGLSKKELRQIPGRKDLHDFPGSHVLPEPAHSGGQAGGGDDPGASSRPEQGRD